MKSWLLMTCLLSFALWLASCSEGDDPISPELTPLLTALPLDSGNYWVHDFLYYRDGALIDSASDSMVIGRQLAWGGEVWREMREALEGWATSHNYYRLAEGGIWWLYVLHGDSTPGMYFKYPTVPGETWLNGRGDTMLTRSLNETVTVPNGVFTGCIHYQYAGDAPDEGMWLKPGVGWILSHWYEQDGVEIWFKMRKYYLM